MSTASSARMGCQSLAAKPGSGSVQATDTSTTSMLKF
jgi:hypothetical protein